MTFRLFYNRSVDWPQVWSIDQGDQSTEFNVIDFLADGCLVRGACLPPAARALEGVATVFPTAWSVIEADRVELVDGIAVFIPCSRG